MLALGVALVPALAASAGATSADGRPSVADRSAASSVATADHAPVGSYRPPVTGTPRLARPFRAPAQRWSAGHRGLDLWLEPGGRVVAPADGVVTFAGTVVDRGVVTVQHDDGRRSSVEPVTAHVVVGQSVEAGDLLGVLQDTVGHCTETCLHWGLREADRYLDPLTVLPDGGPVVLLPPVEPG